MRNRVPDEAGLRLAGSAEPSKVDPGRPVSGLTTLLTIKLAAGFTLFLFIALVTPPAGAVTDLQSLLQNVQQLILRGDFSQARGLLKLARQEFPSDARLPNLLGVVGAQQGNYQAAEKNFRDAIALAPRFSAAYENLGRLYQEHLNRDSEALRKGLETYQGLLRYEPDNVQALYQMAVLLLKQESYKDSLDYVSRLPAEVQRRAMTLSVRCANLAALNQIPEAQKTADQLVRSPDLTALDVTSILPILEKDRRTDIEVRLLEGLVERGMASLDSKRQLALLYEAQGKLDLARKTLEETATQSPKLIDVLVDLARVAYKQKDFEGALGYLAHARDLEPANAGVHFFFGMVCIESELVLEARDSLRKAVELEPNEPYYNYALGAVTIHDKDASESVTHFRKYRDLKPEDPRGRFALGLALYHNANYPAAREQLEAAARSQEAAAGAHYYLGRIQLRQYNHSEAVAHFQEAIQASPGYSDAYADLGLAYTRERQYKLAEEALQRAVELDSQAYRPNMNLLLLYQRTRDERAESQRKKFNQIKKKRAEETGLLLRRVEFRPYK